MYIKACCLSLRPGSLQGHWKLPSRKTQPLIVVSFLSLLVASSEEPAALCPFCAGSAMRQGSKSCKGSNVVVVVVVLCGRGGGGGWGSSGPMSNGDGDSWASGVHLLLLFFFLCFLFGRESMAPMASMSDGEGNCWAGGGKASESLIVFAWVVFMPLGDSCCGFSHGGFGSAHL